MGTHAIVYGGCFTLPCGLTLGVDLINGPGNVLTGRPYFLKQGEKEVDIKRGEWSCFGQTFVMLRKNSKSEQKAFFTTRTVENVPLRKKRRGIAKEFKRRSSRFFYKPDQGE
jgi:hypothetical protein